MNHHRERQFVYFSHLLNVTTSWQILCSADRAPRYNCVKKNQLRVQLILSIFHQPPQVSGIPRPIIRRYNRMYKQLVLIIIFRWPSVVLDGFQSPKKNNKY